MSKKEKKIEVAICDHQVSIDGATVSGYQLMVGKKIIGEIAELEPTQLAVIHQGKTIGFYKKLEQAVQHVIENHNLSH